MKKLFLIKYPYWNIDINVSPLNKKNISKMELQYYMVNDRYNRFLNKDLERSKFDLAVTNF